MHLITNSLVQLYLKVLIIFSLIFVNQVGAESAIDRVKTSQSNSFHPTSVGACSVLISESIGSGDCSSWGDCWYKIAQKTVGQLTCSSVACSTCDVANKFASKELINYKTNVAGCAAAIAEHLGVQNGSIGISVCNIAEVLQETKSFDLKTAVPSNANSTLTVIKPR